MLKSLIDKMVFFESENGYDKKVLPSDIDNNFKDLANRLDERVGKEVVDDVIGGVVKKDYNSLLTTDDTQAEILQIFLKPKAIALLKIKGIVLKDDYSTKWAFEREVLVVVDNTGAITVDTDNNTDIKKDDTNLSFDVTGVNDSANPYMSLKITGVANTNFIWLANVETNLTSSMISKYS